MKFKIAAKCGMGFCTLKKLSDCLIFVASSALLGLIFGRAVLGMTGAYEATDTLMAEVIDAR